MLTSRAGLSGCIVLVIACTLISYECNAFSWTVASLCCWLLFFVSVGEQVSRQDKQQAAWGCLSVAAFAHFLWRHPTFTSWSDVYFFCGPALEFCTCDMDWNLEGWIKAIILWNFVLSTTLALQRLVIVLGLNGLLPGEEAVAKDSFISICWRLIPYCLNNWEKKWGAETTSMMFELPHFALELLVVLPCVQILCSRMKVLTQPAGRVMRAPVALAGVAATDMVLAPCVMQGVWRPLPNQHRWTARLRSNLRPLLVVLGVLALAGANAIIVPLKLERLVLMHPRAKPILQAALLCGQKGACWASLDLGLATNPFARETVGHGQSTQAMRRAIFQHAREMLKMQHPLHMEMLPLVECALAALRMSCERFFLLISVFSAYLLFCTNVPRWFKLLVRFNHRLSKIFQKVILYAFPAVCWTYGAGIIFSTFVSLIFWTVPAKNAYHFIRHAVTIVQPVNLRDSSPEEIENMNGNCSVCWLAMAASQPGASNQPQPGKALACGHSFHGACITKWLAQCHAQNRAPSCPLCNRTIQLQVTYQLPNFWKLSPRVMDIHPEDIENDEEPPVEDLLALRRNEDVPHPSGFEEQGRQAESSMDAADQAEQLSTGAARNPTSFGQSDAAPPLGVPPRQQASSSGHAAWRGPPLPMHLAQGTEQRSTLKARLRMAPSVSGRMRGMQGASSSSSLQNGLPTARSLLPHICRHQGQDSTLGGQCDCSWRGLDDVNAQDVQMRHSAFNASRIGDGGAHSLAGVHRERDRARAIIRMCEAEQADMRLRMQLGADMVQEAKQTASQLLDNADRIEQLIRMPLHQCSALGPGRERMLAELWQQQQELWRKSDRLQGIY